MVVDLRITKLYRTMEEIVVKPLSKGLGKCGIPGHLPPHYWTNGRSKQEYNNSILSLIHLSSLISDVCFLPLMACTNHLWNGFERTCSVSLGL